MGDLIDGTISCGCEIRSGCFSYVCPTHRLFIKLGSDANSDYARAIFEIGAVRREA